eukprot:Tbor_TRINITY_DN6122_c5_g2::TRINITY_DN6122_c5_g2_i20::g.22816::m.22816
MTQDSHKSFGRDTPAGRAIYNIYNKKSIDSTLDLDLLARLNKMRKEKEEEEKNLKKEKIIPKSRAFVNVPKPAGMRGNNNNNIDNNNNINNIIAINKLNAIGR